jgi:3'(2'), 5'-bisphosphate nucleotidase
MRDSDYLKLVSDLYPAVMRAGRLEMGFFKGGVDVETKADKSPVTTADREAEVIILEALGTIAPDVPVVAEEAVAAGIIPSKADRFFLVDALDGTRLFIRGKPEFSVNIALVEQGKPVFGIIYVPPTGDLYFTGSNGTAVRAVAPCEEAEARSVEKLELIPLATRTPDPANLKAFNSQSTGSSAAPFLKSLNVRHAEPVGSSLKFCLIADGQGDIYARIGETSEWDTAAGQAILEAAGGSVTTLDGAPLTYGKAHATYRNPHFVAWGRQPMLTTQAP